MIDKLNILGMSVDIVDELPEDVRLEHGEDYIVMGLCLSDRNMIYISPDISESQRRSTLLHEVLEMIKSRCDLNLTHAALQTLEAVLFQIIVDNENFIHYIGASTVQLEDGRDGLAG